MLGLLGVAIAVTALAGFPRAVPLALVPTAALSTGICLARPAAKRLREMGWAMIGSSLVTLLVLVATLR